MLLRRTVCTFPWVYCRGQTTIWTKSDLMFSLTIWESKIVNIPIFVSSGRVEFPHSMDINEPWVIWSRFKSLSPGNTYMSQWITQSHKSHNAPMPSPSMLHFVIEMCTFVHTSVTKRCIVRYLSDALWDLWDGSITLLMAQLMTCRLFSARPLPEPIPIWH